MTTHTCPRCNGTGRYSYNPIHGNVCLGCRGSGTVAKKPRAPAPKWAVFGQHQATGVWMRLYNIVARTDDDAISTARRVMDSASADWRRTYSLDSARAIRWDAMADVQALTWDEAVDPITSHYTDRNEGCHAAKAP